MKRYFLIFCGLLLFCVTIFLWTAPPLKNQSKEKSYFRAEVKFDHRHFTVIGDLYAPSPKKKNPVIIFVHGDGPARRSSSRAPNRLMRNFLEIGFACYYYDKPGYGESKGKFTSGKLFEERASILVEAVAILKLHPLIDPDMIGLWGISQAGWVMPKAISMSEDIAFMIAVSCAGVDGIEQSAYLVEQQILCEGYSKGEAKKARMYYNQRARAKTYEEYLEAAEFLDKHPVISTMGWGGIKSEEKFSPAPASYSQFFNPIPVIEKMKIPVLAIYGDKDTQVDPFQGMNAYKNALEKAKNPFYRVEIFKNADHGIIQSKTGCLKEQRQRRSARFARGFLELMQNWLKNLKLAKEK
jgi:pimeloyl-ACP methyl ester carboxylesterase